MSLFKAERNRWRTRARSLFREVFWFAPSSKKKVHSLWSGRPAHCVCYTLGELPCVGHWVPTHITSERFVNQKKENKI